LKSAPNLKRSFGDIADETILGDVPFFAIGYCLMVFYASVMLGRFNMVEQRNALATVGVIGVIMGVFVSYGVASALGFLFGPMHNVLPFLLLGIGIDDMFVIVQCFETVNNSPQNKERSLHERFGLTMRHAGAAITVTSLTDIIAFAVGGFTILPALQSFCIYSSLGIIAIFIFQSTFFVAWFSLDQRRIESKRNFCAPCIIHEKHTFSGTENKHLVQTTFRRLGELLANKWVKVVVILVTGSLACAGGYGSKLLRQEFDPAWFIPQETYLSDWFTFGRTYFSHQGQPGTIYFIGTELPQDIIKIEYLVSKLKNSNESVQSVNSWTSAYINYVDTYNLTNIEDLTNIDEIDFRRTLSQFLHSPSGAPFKINFNFNGSMVCGDSVPDIVMSQVSYVHKKFYGPETSIPAMNEMKALVQEANFTGNVFPFSHGYAAWETDEVIEVEVYRNLGLALVCVFFTTLFFICNFRAAVIIIFCVVVTLVNVGGFMHWWGLTIDTVSCTMLVIAIGLCVDYSAHIAHRYLIETGNKDEKVVKTLEHIGPAVFNGGFSTFLAFVLLAGSKSHVFMSFFKVFFLVVVFGLYHGLVFLPVLLSIVGPSY